MDTPGPLARACGHPDTPLPTGRKQPSGLPCFRGSRGTFCQQSGSLTHMPPSSATAWLVPGLQPGERIALMAGVSGIKMRHCSGSRGDPGLCQHLGTPGGMERGRRQPTVWVKVSRCHRERLQHHTCARRRLHLAQGFYFPQRTDSQITLYRE